ncbi:hypothetical protein BZZ08_02783 [Streptomyces sp. MH60]|nr:hypothetical protein BZZ08_02783 [Streptomyces sp. MH60]
MREVRGGLLGLAPVQQHERARAQQVGGLLGRLQLPHMCQALVEQFEGPVVRAAPVGETAQRVEAVGHAPTVTGGAEPLQGAGEGGLRLGRPAREQLLVADTHVEQGQPPGGLSDLDPRHGVRHEYGPAGEGVQDDRERQPQRPVQRLHQRRHPRDPPGPGRITAPVPVPVPVPGDRVHGAQRVLLGQSLGRLVADRCQQRAGPRHLFAVQTAQPAEPGQRGHEPQGLARAGLREVPLGRVQIAQLGGEPGQPG